MWSTGFRGGYKSVAAGMAFALLLGSLPLQAKSYRSELREWSRSKQLFSATTMHAKVITHATYFSPDFRKAYIKEHVKRKYLEGERADYFIDQLEARQAKAREFFVEMYAPKPYRNFSMGKESFWEIVLTTQNGKELKPISIEAVETTPYQKVMFPYISRWSKAYRVLFPMTDLGKNFELTLRSVIGQTHLNW